MKSISSLETKPFPFLGGFCADYGLCREYRDVGVKRAARPGGAFRVSRHFQTPRLTTSDKRPEINRPMLLVGEVHAPREWVAEWLTAS